MLMGRRRTLCETLKQITFGNPPLMRDPVIMGAGLTFFQALGRDSETTLRRHAKTSTDRS